MGRAVGDHHDRGKSWRRVRVVELPLSEYVRWEAAAYIESAVLSEEIRVLVRTDQFASLTEDFWLFGRRRGQALRDRYGV